MLSLILKTSDTCNLRCEYCSIGEKTTVSIMTYPQMFEAICWFVEYAKIMNEDEAFVIFHGGEPLILSPHQYVECIESVRERYPNFKLKYSIQTNGTIIDDDIIKMIKKYNIRVGVSFDGNKDLHDIHRHHDNGNGSYDCVLENIHRLKKSKIDVSGILVVTSRSIRSDFTFLEYLEEIQMPIKVNPLLDVGSAIDKSFLKLKSGDYAEYLIRMLKYVEENKLRVFISPICELILKINDICDIRGCTFQHDCNKKFICITANGDIYPCGRYADIDNLKYGNIGRISPIEMKTKRESFMFELPKECENCKLLYLCNAGCPTTRKNVEGIYKQCFCNDYKCIFEFLQKEENYPFYYEFLKSTLKKKIVNL